MTLPGRKERPYPESDGKPTAETDVHRDQMTDPLYAIRWHFRDQPDLYVSGNLLMFYEPGNRRKHVAPDLFVVRGVGNHSRPNYLVWEEKRPDLVLEISSKSTWEEDFGQKKAVYARLGVPEYYLFDPTGEYLRPPLRGYRLSGEEYLPVLGSPMSSAALGLTLHVLDGKLRLGDAAGRLLPIPGEAYAGWEQERLRAEQERLRADEAQAEVERLRRLLEERG